jgi:hypothetical protein
MIRDSIDTLGVEVLATHTEARISGPFVLVELELGLIQNVEPELGWIQKEQREVLQNYQSWTDPFFILYCFCYI